MRDPLTRQSEGSAGQSGSPRGTPREPDEPTLPPWDAAYASGDPLIDREHRELFALGAEVLAAADRRGHEPWVLRSALDALFLHLAQHFADEEAILGRIGYPRLDAHRRTHRELLVRARALELQAEEGTITRAQLADFLALDVVVGHLLECDRDYFPLLRAAH